MKILLVYTHINVAHNLSYPAGLGYVASYLKQNGHDVGLSYLTSIDESFSTLRSEIKHFSPDIIAYSSVSSQFPYISEIAGRVGKRFEHIFQVCGGVHITLRPEDFDLQSPFDAIVIGEGEYPLSELAAAIEKKNIPSDIQNIRIKRENSRIVTNPLRPFIKEIDILPFPDREIFNYQQIIDSDGGYGRFIFSRGCPFKCSYCSNEALSLLTGGKYYRTRSVENAIIEIEDVLRRYNVKQIAFDDDILTLNKPWFHEFIKEYKKNFKLSFACNVRPGSANADMYHLLKEAGCKIVGMGIESGCDHLRQDVLGRKISRDQIIKSFQWAKEAGLHVKSYNLIGLPFETPVEFLQTIALNAQAKSSSRTVNVFYPYKNTKLGDMSYKNDLVIKNVKGKRERVESILKNPYFPNKLISHLKENFDDLVEVFSLKESSNNIQRDITRNSVIRFKQLKREFEKERTAFMNLLILELLEEVKQGEKVLVFTEKDFIDEILAAFDLFKLDVKGVTTEITELRTWEKKIKKKWYKLFLASLDDTGEIRKYLSRMPVEYIDLFASIRPIKKKKMQWKAEDLTAVVCTTGEITYTQCIESLKSQTLQPAYIEIVSNVSPMYKAFNHMLKAVDTEYFIHVDADMILSEDCLETLYKEMKGLRNCFLVRAYLYDDLIGKIGNLKLFNRKLIGNTRYNNVIGCDRDFEMRMEKKGYVSVTVDKIVAKHISSYDRRNTFFKYQRTMEKSRYFNDRFRPVLKKLLSNLEGEWDLLNLYALAGFFSGLHTHETEFVQEKDFREIQTDDRFKQVDQSLMRGLSETQYAVRQAYYYLKQNEKLLADAFSKLAMEKLDGDSADALDCYSLGSLLKKLGNNHDSIRIFKALLSLNHELSGQMEGGVYFHLGENYLELNDKKTAIENFKKCLRFIPNHQKAREYLK